MDVAIHICSAAYNCKFSFLWILTQDHCGKDVLLQSLFSLIFREGFFLVTWAKVIIWRRFANCKQRCVFLRVFPRNVLTRCANYNRRTFPTRILTIARSAEFCHKIVFLQFKDESVWFASGKRWHGFVRINVFRKNFISGLWMFFKAFACLLLKEI